MIINESKKEYLYFEKYDLSVKSFMFPEHGLILAYLMHYSDWNGDNIRMIDDTNSDTADYFDNILDNWKNREDDFINEYLEFVKDEEHLKEFAMIGEFRPKLLSRKELPCK